MKKVTLYWPLFILNLINGSIEFLWKYNRKKKKKNFITLHAKARILVTLKSRVPQMVLSPEISDQKRPNF